MIERVQYPYDGAFDAEFNCEVKKWAEVLHGMSCQKVCNVLQVWLTGVGAELFNPYIFAATIMVSDACSLGRAPRRQ
jgi:hypothetical protein